MKLSTTFDLGDVVYLITDLDQKKRIVTQICFSWPDKVTYQLSCGSDSSWHYDIEISKNKDYAL